jgi:hypothetical protein
MSIEARLQRLEDIEEIKQLKARYCAGCDDDHNADIIASLFVEDGVWDTPGIARAEGRLAIHKLMTSIRKRGIIRNSAHQVMNPIIEVDGDCATGRWRFLMMYTGNVGDGTTQAIRVLGWYREEYVRMEGRWYYQSLYASIEDNSPYVLEESRRGR